MGRIAILLGLVLLAACARSEDASVVADTNELKAVEQVRTPEEDDEETAIGEWRETLQDENPALEFGPSGTPPLFSLRCDARRSVFLQRHGAAAPGDLPVMLVSIGSETRRLAVTSAGGAVPMLRASLTASDELIRILGGATTPGRMTMLQARNALRTFAEETGGVYIPITFEGELPSAMHTINVLMRNQYSLAYSPGAARADKDKRRKIVVKVDVDGDGKYDEKDYEVRARQFYNPPKSAEQKAGNDKK